MSTEGAASRSAIVIRHGASKQNPKPLPSKYAAALAMVEKTVEKNVVHSNLTEELLVSLTDAESLTEVRSFEIAVNTVDSSAAILGDLMPNLVELKLNDSILATLRDLGTGLSNLRVLWLARCGLTDLDGLSGLPALAELYLAFNNIEDVSPLALHEKLEVLDLEGNRIADESALLSLSLVPRLHTLTLEGNPIALEPSYRELVAANLPQLVVLDDAPLEHEGSDAEAGDDSDSDDNDSDGSDGGMAPYRKSTASGAGGAGAGGGGGAGAASFGRAAAHARGHTDSSLTGRAATAASDPRSLGDPESKTNSPDGPLLKSAGGAGSGGGGGSGRGRRFEHIAEEAGEGGSSSSSGFSGSGSASAALTAARSPSSGSGALSHEAYTVAQSLRTKGQLGADADFLMNGSSSPTDRPATAGGPSGGWRGDRDRDRDRERERESQWSSKHNEDEDEAGASAAGSDDDEEEGGSAGAGGGIGHLSRRQGSASLSRGGSAHSAGGSGWGASSSSRPTSSLPLARPTTASSAGIAARNSRPQTASSFGSFASSLASRPGSARPRGDATSGGGAGDNNAALNRSVASDASSCLTHGDAGAVVFAGNPVMAMRRMRAAGGGGAAGLSPGRASVCDESGGSFLLDTSSFTTSSFRDLNGGGGAGAAHLDMDTSLRSTGGGGGVSLDASLNSTHFSVALAEERASLTAAFARAGLAPAAPSSRPGTAVRRPGTASGGRGGAAAAASSRGDTDLSSVTLGDGDMAPGSGTSIIDVLNEGKREDEEAKRHKDEELRLWRAELKSSSGSRPTTTGSPQAPGKFSMSPPPSKATAAPAATPDVTAAASAAAPTTPAAPAAAATAASVAVGDSVAKSDEELVHMLKQKPKHVPELHNRDSFRRFFAGMPTHRMRALLTAAYSDLPPAECEDKVRKRLELLDGVLC